MTLATCVPLSNAMMSHFADKLMANRPIYSASDYHLWQLDIDKLCDWTDGNLLIFNIQKVLRTKHTLPATPHMINQSCLVRVNSYKYILVSGLAPY